MFECVSVCRVHNHVDRNNFKVVTKDHGALRIFIDSNVSSAGIKVSPSGYAIILRFLNLYFLRRKLLKKQVAVSSKYPKNN